eukprot:2861770-Rhodomonas_salina.1
MAITKCDCAKTNPVYHTQSDMGCKVSFRGGGISAGVWAYRIESRLDGPSILIRVRSYADFWVLPTSAVADLISLREVKSDCGKICAWGNYKK